MSLEPKLSSQRTFSIDIDRKSPEKDPKPPALPSQKGGHVYVVMDESTSDEEVTSEKASKCDCLTSCLYKVGSAIAWPFKQLSACCSSDPHPLAKYDWYKNASDGEQHVARIFHATQQSAVKNAQSQGVELDAVTKQLAAVGVPTIRSVFGKGRGAEKYEATDPLVALQQQLDSLEEFAKGKESPSIKKALAQIGQARDYAAAIQATFGNAFTKGSIELKEMARNQLISRIQEDVRKLPERESLLIPIGYTDQEGGGHAELLQLTRLDDKTFRACLINTGEGNLGTAIEFDMDEAELQHSIEPLVELNATADQKNTAKGVNEALGLDKRKYTAINNRPPEQRGGTCAYSVVLGFITVSCGKEIHDRFVADQLRALLGKHRDAILGKEEPEVISESSKKGIIRGLIEGVSNQLQGADLTTSAGLIKAAEMHLTELDRSLKK